MNFHTPNAEDTRLAPVSKSALEIRINPLAWPTALDSQEGGIPSDMSEAWNEAVQTHNAFQAHYGAKARDEKLSPAGVAAENAAWARRELPKLEKRLAQITERADQVIERFGKKIMDEFMGGFAGEPTEPNEIAMAQEIRTYIRGLPETQRTHEVRKLVEQGDKAAIRAVLTAPAYLTGVDQAFIQIVRDEMVKKTNPERFAKLEALRAGREATVRALDGVIRHIGSETQTLAELRPGAGA